MAGKILPNGTVVRLSGDEGYIMICGRLIEAEDENGEDTVYEYAGVAFPVGVTGSDYFLFDGDEIEELIFIGYQDERELEYQAMIEKAIEEL